MAKGERKEPARLLKDLLGQMGSPELSDWRPDIVRIVHEFTKKPRRELLEILDKRNREHANPGQCSKAIARSPDTPSFSPASALATEFRHELDGLRERHIFQWSTFYRDCFDSYFDRFLEAMGLPSPDEPVRAVADPLADHALAIFSQGYEFVRRTHEHKDTINKSLAGLSQFLSVPLDYYSARASIVSDYRSILTLRLLFSAALSGILEGYSRGSCPQAWCRSWSHHR